MSGASKRRAADPEPMAGACLAGRPFRLVVTYRLRPSSAIRGTVTHLRRISLNESISRCVTALVRSTP